MCKNRLKMFWFIPFLVISIGMMALFVVYKQREGLIDRSIINGNPCSVPCWQGIVPGTTTYEEALVILEQSTYVKKSSLKQAGNNEFGGVLWEWKGAGIRLNPSLFWKDNIIQEITLGLTFDLRLGEVIEQLGAPEAVVVNRGGQSENWYWIIDLYYPGIGAQFKAYTTEFSDLLEASTEIGVAILYSPMPIAERLQNQYNSPNATILSHIIRNLRPWRGYGHIFGTYYASEEELIMGK